MKKDLSKTFIGLDGKPIGEELKFMLAEEKKTIDPEGNEVVDYIPFKNGNILAFKKGEPLTLKKVCQDCLLIDAADEKLSGDDKSKRGELGMRILLSKENEIELDLKDLTLLRDVILKKQNTLIAYQAQQMLDIKS